MGIACAVIIADALKQAKGFYYRRNVMRFRARMHRNRFHSGFKQNARKFRKIKDPMLQLSLSSYHDSLL